MAEKVTYYAIVDDYTSKDNPAGVLRRFYDGDRRDESFGRDLEWKFSSLLHSAERGDTQYELIPITEEAANQIVARIRETAGPTALIPTPGLRACEVLPCPQPHRMSLTIETPTDEEAQDEAVSDELVQAPARPVGLLACFAWRCPPCW
jgi:hypothetical protein